MTSVFERCVIDDTALYTVGNHTNGTEAIIKLYRSRDTIHLNLDHVVYETVNAIARSKRGFLELTMSSAAKYIACLGASDNISCYAL